MGKLRPEAGRLIQGHAAGQAFAGSRGRPGASCAVGALEARSVSETVGTAASEPRPGHCPSDLLVDKDCFVLSALGPLSPVLGDILHS